MGKAVTLEELQGIIRNLGESQRELNESRKITEKVLQDLGESQKELNESQKETERILKETHQETAREQRKTDKQLKKLEDLFTSQWSKLIESLVEGDLVNILKKQHIDVVKTMTRIDTRKRGGISYEFDIFAVNGSEVVVVEVKTTLKPKDTDYFIKKLGVFKEIFPEYSHKKIYGAVAYLKDHSHGAKYSEKKGLFVIRATGDSASIINDKNFTPKAF